jgi:hypothetical protein
MIVDNKNVASAAALACMAQLTSEIVLRLSRNGIPGTVDGNYVTRTSVASSALSTARAELMK